MWGCWSDGGGAVVEVVGGGQGRGSRRHCMPPMTLASGSPFVGADEDGSLLNESSFRLPGRDISRHRAQSARDEGEALAIESV